MLAAGAAAMWFLERRHMLPGQARPALPWPQATGPQSPDTGPQTAEPGTRTPDLRPQSPELASVEAEAEPVAEEEDEEAHVEEPAAPEQPTREQPAVEREGEPEPVDVTTVVDDLIAPGAAREGSIVDAEVVPEEPPPPKAPGDEEIAHAVRDELSTVPGIPAGAVTVEVRERTVYLRGKIDSPATISELDRRVREIEGVDRLRNLLHLPGTPPPV